MSVRRTGPYDSGSPVDFRNQDRSSEPSKRGTAPRELAGSDLLRETTLLSDRLKVRADEVAAKVATVSDTVSSHGVTGSVGAVLGHLFETLPSGQTRADAIADLGQQTANRLARSGLSIERSRQIFNEVLNAVPKDATAETIEILANGRLKDLLEREFAQSAGADVAADLIRRFGANSAKRALDGASYIVPGHNPLARLLLSFSQVALSAMAKGTS